MTKNTRITWRCLLLSLILVPINIWWIYQYEVVLFSGSPTTLSIFYTSVFILLVIVAANMLVNKFAPKYTLSQVELLIIYITLNVSAAVTGHDFLHVFITNMAYPIRYATAENNWYNLFINKIPDWAIVKDKATADAFYVGGDNFFQWKYIQHWVRPVAVWGTFMLVLFYVMLCINTILRRQWSENEKLSYPLISMPLEVTKENTNFFNNRVLYWGIAAAFLFSLIQGLNMVFPSFPVLSLKNMDISLFLVNPPFNAIGMTPIRIYPIAIGIIFLVPADLSFSYWFFYLFTKFQFIFGASAGINTIPKYPFINEQCFGFLIGIFVFAVFMGKDHFKKVFSTIISKEKSDDSKEPMSYRNSVWGMIIGMCAMMILSRVLGSSAWIAVTLVVVYFIICVSLTRTRAELGTPCHEINWSSITSILLANVGTATLGPQNVISIQMFHWFNRCFRNNMMPVQLESFKMAERSGMNQKHLVKVIMFFTVFSLICGFTCALYYYYKLGAASNMASINVWLGAEYYNTLDASLRSGTITDWNGIGVAIGGFVSCILLSIAKIKIPGFPLNPVAYAMMSTYSTHFLWASAFIAWACKVLILRYGGLKVFTKTLPFFLGLIIGDCLAGAFWCILGMILGTQTYAIFP